LTRRSNVDTAVVIWNTPAAADWLWFCFPLAPRRSDGPPDSRSWKLISLSSVRKTLTLEFKYEAAALLFFEFEWFWSQGNVISCLVT